MREQVLYDFLVGRTGAWRLRRALGELGEEPAGAHVPLDVFPHHLLALCEAVLARELEPPHLPPIARRLQRSGAFRVTHSDPDRRVVEEVLVAWSEGAASLRDPEDVLLFRDWLVTRRRPGGFDPGT